MGYGLRYQVVRTRDFDERLELEISRMVCLCLLLRVHPLCGVFFETRLVILLMSAEYAAGIARLIRVESKLPMGCVRRYIALS